MNRDGEKEVWGNTGKKEKRSEKCNVERDETAQLDMRNMASSHEKNASGHVQTYIVMLKSNGIFDHAIRRRELEKKSLKC